VRRRIGGNHAGCSDELSCGRVERTRNQPGALSLFNYFNLIMAHDNDPREHALESSFTIPQTWSSQDNLGSCLFCPSPPLPCTPTHSGDNSDGLATSGMFLAGLIMVTRNRLLRIQYPITTPLLITACCTGSSPGHLSFSASAPGSINTHSELGRALHRLSEI
jgi:hypothetical protein